MKKNERMETVRKENRCPQYLGGVPLTERERYWAGSPWNAFQLLRQDGWKR